MNNSNKYRGGLRKGEVNALRAKVQEQEETIKTLNHQLALESHLIDEAQARVDQSNASSLWNKLTFIFLGKKL